LIKKYTFNKTKSNSIILLHGLYTTSGFWLSYLNFFRDFRIITYDINYDLLLREQNPKRHLQKYLNKFGEDENIVATISHSFGTVVSDLVFENKKLPVFKICPVAFSKRLDTQSFILDIENKTSISIDRINEYLQLVSNFNLIFKDQLNLDGFIYIPDKDGFFYYNVPESKIKVFNGDHFNISNALSDIIATLSQY
jgi:hypothetical protein